MLKSKNENEELKAYIKHLEEKVRDREEIVVSLESDMKAVKNIAVKW